MRQKKRAVAVLEARAWLERNQNERGFASNAFGATENALNAVRRLYDAGAKNVVVSGIHSETSRIARDGGPHADTLLVTLPKGTKQDEVMAVAWDMAPDEIGVNKRGQLRLWWD